jgi:MATE family multidrug resistance protein
LLVLLRNPIVSIYSANETVASAGATALTAFAIAWFFDFTQCQLSGVIKAVRKQAIASVASFLCMVCISLPVGYLCGVSLGWGLPGFWAGYGASSLCLASTYFIILIRIDWSEQAAKASRDELSESDLSYEGPNILESKVVEKEMIAKKWGPTQERFGYACM